GRSAIIPTLLSYPGPVIVIDPKGENYQVTARRRREMGQRVFKLDPFSLTGDDSHCLNLLDTFDPTAPDAYDEAMTLAELLAPKRFVTDPFWDDSARLLLTALILHVASARPPVLRNLSEVTYLINQSAEDLGFTIKEMLKSKHEMVRYLARGFSATEAKVWASILSTAKAATAVFNGINFGAISGTTDIPMSGIVRGDPISIYLILPPDKLDSHGRMLRAWIGALMNQISKRRHQVPTPTLFILDEAAQLGTLQQLRRAITLMRGYGLRTWSFWQDLSQLKSLYPDWQTLYNNTRYIQTFGATTHLLAESIANLLRLPGEIDPLNLPHDQLILAEAGRDARVLDKPDYLNDAPFRGLYDDNSFYQPMPESPLADARREPPWRNREAPGGAHDEGTERDDDADTRPDLG
ncbi:MAG: type IV secretory system conjugative DNA transfer family protein, partial [Candidatus Wenzhouxiangella sp. M2_3B_020]